MRRRDGDHDRRLSDPDAADAVRDRDRAEVVRALEVGGQVGHDLLGHALVGLVVEVEHRAAAGLDARRADEDRGAAGRSSATSATTAATSSGSALSRNAPPETGGMSATSSPSASSRSGGGVLAVDGVEQARRLVAELERRPDVADAFDAVEIALRPAGTLAQAGEETHADLHHDESRHYDRGAGSRSGRWCDVQNRFARDAAVRLTFPPS